MQELQVNIHISERTVKAMKECMRKVPPMISFLNNTIICVDSTTFEQLKFSLGKGSLCAGMSFRYTNPEDVSTEVLAEKLQDYFDKVLIKGNPYNDPDYRLLFRKYLKQIASVVKPHIPQEPTQKKGQPKLPTPRTRKYYDYAITLQNKAESDFEALRDYSRIMFCLYVAVINAGGGSIEDFEYSRDCLDVNAIIEELQDEKEIKRSFGKDSYNFGHSSLVIASVLLYTIMGDKTAEEEGNE